MARAPTTVWEVHRSQDVIGNITKKSAFYQAEYSHNLLFRVGAQRDHVFDRIVDRTRFRLDVPTLRTLFGAKQRPGRNGTPDLSPRCCDRDTSV